MRYVLGHRTVWYMVMNVLEGHFGSLHRPSEDRLKICWKTRVPTGMVAGCVTAVILVFSLSAGRRLQT